MSAAPGTRPGAGTELADRLQRSPGLGALIAFYRYIQFDLPRTTTATGVLLLWGIAAVRIYLLVAARTAWVQPGGSVRPQVPVYLQAYLGLVAVVAVVASGAIMAARSRTTTRAGWALGSLVCAAAMAMYVTSRTAGLPGAGDWVGRWDFPLGTFAVTLEAAFLLTHVAVLTGMTVAAPDRRHWRD